MIMSMIKPSCAQKNESKKIQTANQTVKTRDLGKSIKMPCQSWKKVMLCTLIHAHTRDPLILIIILTLILTHTYTHTSTHIHSHTPTHTDSYFNSYLLPIPSLSTKKKDSKKDLKQESTCIIPVGTERHCCAYTENWIQL